MKDYAMTFNFFDQLKGQPWTPPQYPALNDEKWRIDFDNGSVVERTNISNAWLWLLNRAMPTDKLSYDDIGQYLALEVMDQYQLLREILPLRTPGLLNDQVFDGSTESLLKYFARVTDERKAVILPNFEDLWFGTNEKRVASVKVLAEELSDLTLHGGDLPRARNLMQNLAWDVVTDNPDDAMLKASAARISVLYGIMNFDIPKRTHPENTAWHTIAKIANHREGTSIYNSVDWAMSVILQSSPVVAAVNIPTLMHIIRGDSETMPYYNTRQGVTYVVDGAVDKITDYDILRTWIPSKCALINAAEGLELPYREVCAQIVAESTAAKLVDVALPSEITSSATFY